jgi:hypothetical protein
MIDTMKEVREAAERLKVARAFMDGQGKPFNQANKPTSEVMRELTSILESGDYLDVPLKTLNEDDSDDAFCDTVFSPENNVAIHAKVKRVLEVCIDGVFEHHEILRLVDEILTKAGIRLTNSEGDIDPHCDFLRYYAHK